MITLFPDEEILTQSPEGMVILTTHRICYEYKELGRSYNQSIALEHITSCENFYNTQIWLLILGGIIFLGGLFAGTQNNSGALSIAILVAIVCGGLYLLTRQNFIIIASPSTKMKIKVTGMKREQVLSFINKVEQAKNKRDSLK